MLKCTSNLLNLCTKQPLGFHWYLLPSGSPKHFKHSVHLNNIHKFGSDLTEISLHYKDKLVNDVKDVKRNHVNILCGENKSLNF